MEWIIAGILLLIGLAWTDDSKRRANNKALEKTEDSKRFDTWFGPNKGDM